jgi:ubiquinone/menaquinone biosynthesis C-methylase UbiE
MNREHRSAHFFDKCAEEKILDEFELGEEEVARQLIAGMHLRPDWTIAEPGCGSGRITRLLCEAIGVEGKIYACDFSRGMVASCKRQGFPAQVVISPSPADNLPIADVECDAVVCFNAFPHFEDKQAVLKEFQRVLKPGGKLFIAHSISRKQVDKIHSSAHSCAIRDHLVPDEEQFRIMLDKTGFVVEEIMDGADRYFLASRKKEIS